MVLLFGSGPKDGQQAAVGAMQAATAANAMPGGGGAGELAEKLGFVDRLHRAGELTDAEFTAAKRNLLEK